MVQRSFAVDAAGGGADDHGEFHLPVKLLRDLGVVFDGITGADPPWWGGFEKITGCFGRSFEVSRRSTFGDMFDVVQADAEDVLARARNRGEQGDIGQIGGNAGAIVALGACKAGFQRGQTGRPVSIRPSIEHGSSSPIITPKEPHRRPDRRP